MKELATDNPTSDVLKIAEQCGGEIPELRITRPSLEDIYLKMISREETHA